jgi:hypothetical protein
MFQAVSWFRECQKWALLGVVVTKDVTKINSDSGTISNRGIALIRQARPSEVCVRLGRKLQRACACPRVQVPNCANTNYFPVVRFAA